MLIFKSKGYKTSLSSMLMPAVVDEVTKSGPGVPHAEHTSHDVRVVLSHSNTKTPPALQTLCSNRTAEMTELGGDVRCMLHVSDVMNLTSPFLKEENVSNMSRSLLVTTNIEA